MSVEDWLVRTPTMTFRRVRPDDDNAVFFDAMVDWRPDQYGPMTRRRAIDHVSAHVTGGQMAQYPTRRGCDPLTHCECKTCSDFFDLLVIEVDGWPIGVTLSRVWKNRCWVEYISLLPEQRGQGHFAEIYRLYAWYGFEVLKAERMWFDAYSDVVALKNLREQWEGQTLQQRRSRGQHNNHIDKTKWMFTREHYEAVDRDVLYSLGSDKMHISVNHTFLEWQNQNRRSPYASL